MNPIGLTLKLCDHRGFRSKSQAFCFSHIPLMSEKSGIAIKDDDQQQIDVFKYEAKNDKPGKPWYRVDPNQLKVRVFQPPWSITVALSWHLHQY
jgi:hypothetical protein